MSSYLSIPSTLERWVVVENKVLCFNISGGFKKEVDISVLFFRLGTRLEVDIVSMLITKGVDEIEILKLVNGKYKNEIINNIELSKVYQNLANQSIFIGKRDVVEQGVRAEQYIFVIKKGVLSW